MATTSENWSEYDENTQLGNIAGWAASGFGTNVQALQVNASSQVKNTSSGSGCLAYFDSGSASSYSEVEMIAASYPGPAYFGPAVRCIDFQNFIGVRVRTSDLEIYQRTGSNTFTRLQLSSSVTIANGDLVRLEVDGDTLRCYVNNTQVNTDLDITGIHSGNNVGLFASGAASDPVFGDLEIGTLSSDTITIDSSPDRTVFPVFGTSRNHTISGAYSGTTTPTSIEYRIEEFVSGATVRDWTVLDASPTAGAYSAIVSIPKGSFYRILTRFSNLTAVLASTSRIGFGILAEFGGQSNTASLFTVGSSATPTDDTAIFDGSTTWNLPTTQIVANALNQISAENNCVAGCYSTAVGGTIITQHLPGGSNYSARQAALTAAGGELNFFYWGLGESDAAAGNQATHLANMGTLRQDILTRTSQVSSSLPMFVVSLGRNEGQTGQDAGWQGIRAVQSAFVQANNDVYMSHYTLDLPMADSLHRDDDGSTQEALRSSDTFNSVYTGSGNTGSGPIPVSASVNGADVEITHDLNGSTSITLPANAQDGYEVSEDDFVSLLTISSISTLANIITLTTSASISGEVKIRSQQGQDPDETKMPTGNLLYSGQAVMVAPIVSELQSATVSSTLNLTATGLPDGSYSAQFWNDDVDPMARLKVEDVTFASGQAQTSIPLDSGANIYTRIDTPTPLVTGVTCVGVTE